MAWYLAFGVQQYWHDSLGVGTFSERSGGHQRHQPGWGWFLHLRGKWLIDQLPLRPLCLRPHVVLPSAGLHHPVCPPSCVSASPSASLRTAAVTGCTSMGTANARRAGMGLAVTTWCANRPPAVPTVSVHRMAVRVMLDGEGRTAAKLAIVLLIRCLQHGERRRHTNPSLISEQRLLIVTGLLTFLLLASLVGHLIKMCRGSAAHHPSRVDNSYVSPTEINGGVCGSGVRGKGSQPNRGVFEMED
ncbi:uncharacterized protein LOC115103480 [Oncorhynchus nerka]|uniref:uncharacterized protein LOC115103480 n=1 Tax=Oncorhynchus nerka TaxID=8023 RepID=UPI00112FD9CA|nr:uncharacterized protein LOC115103480 [Oncorhynchus nerka]